MDVFLVFFKQMGYNRWHNGVDNFYGRYMSVHRVYFGLQKRSRKYTQHLQKICIIVTGKTSDQNDSALVNYSMGFLPSFAVGCIIASIGLYSIEKSWVATPCNGGAIVTTFSPKYRPLISRGQALALVVLSFQVFSVTIAFAGVLCLPIPPPMEWLPTKE